MTLNLIVIAAWAVCDAPGSIEPYDAERSQTISIHALEFETHRAEPSKERGLQWHDASTHALSDETGLRREVLGYLPYWELDYNAFHWDKLTTLAFFAVDMESNGDVSDLHGWDGPTSTALRDEAHANGVRYILTVINFSASEIDALVNDPVARTNGVQQLLGAVLAMEADGVNIDFESVPVSAKNGLTAFVKETTEAFHANIPGSQVTVATPAVDWSGAFDYDQLAIHSDGLMIMGYGYHWKGGNPGPISPVTAGEIWGEKTLTWTIEDYFTWGGEENRHKFILGLPFYGRDWPSDGPEIPGTALSEGAYEPFYDCKDRAQALGGFVWDEHSKTSYFMEQIDGVWHQIWCDNGPSWVEKLALVEAYDLQGIGIWALGYDGTTEDYWDAIGDAFLQVSDDPEPEIVEDSDDTPSADAGNVNVVERPDDGPDVSSPAPDITDSRRVDAGGGSAVIGTPRAPDSQQPTRPRTSQALLSTDGGCSSVAQSSPAAWGWLLLLAALTLFLLGHRQTNR